MRTFQAYPPALHLFCSKRFDHFDGLKRFATVSTLRSMFAQVTMLHLQHILKAPVRQPFMLGEMTHIEVHILLWCIHRHF